MNKNRNILSAILTSFILMCFVSCAEDMADAPSLYDEPVPLTVIANVGGSGSATTRAAITPIDDKWSYTDFVSNDAMGFYSSSGNWLENDGKGTFVNQKLIYDGSRFRGPDGESFSPTHMTGAKIFMYYPYYEDMEETGLNLRQQPTANDTLRCVDFLSSNSIELQGVVNNNHVALYGTFDHAFSELIIMRGEGFDNPPKGKERITAVLHEPYTNIRVKVENDDDGNWSCAPELVFDATTAKELTKEDLTEEELKKMAQRWDAWWGDNYHISTEDKVGKIAWYVIVPTIGSLVGKKKDGPRSYVEYVELYDNEGELYQITSLKLSGANTKYVDAGWRYPIEITMKELVPTVNPFPIKPWNEDVNLTDERKRGISNESEFKNWLEDYNAYLADKTDDTKINALLKYGDMYVVEGQEDNRSWHFYVLSDLDVSDDTFSYTDTETNRTVIIPQLNDILDGMSTTLVNSKFINYTIKGLSKTFINKLGPGGSLQNLDFIAPSVINDENSTLSTGIIANEMESASVINCNIEDGTLLNPGGPAGMVAGKMNGGSVKDCTFSGFLIASQTSNQAPKIIGEEPTGEATFENNNAADVSEKAPEDNTNP